MYITPKNIWGRSVVTATALTISIWIVVAGYPMWLHKLNYGTFAGIIEDEVIINQPALYKVDGENIKLNDTSKYYILDFWHSKCGVCFEEFEYTEKKWRNLDGAKFEFYAVNFLLTDESPLQNERLLRKQGLSFPMLAYKGSREDLSKTFLIEAFPTVLIVKNMRIIHYGNFISAEKHAKSILRNL
jgi:thiol-disulfide isomerase/thioredoxin